MKIVENGISEWVFTNLFVIVKFYFLVKNMDGDFLRYYFEENLYLHNSPMNMDEFINFCKKRGIKIDKNKLEYFEKNKLFYPIFRVTDNFDSFSAQYVAPDFRKYFHDDLLDDLNSGKIYIPYNKEFVEFKNFYDSKTHSLKTYSYYSSFQIWPLIKILENEKIVNYCKSMFENFVNLLIAIQIYSPYGRSNLRRISVNTEVDIFYKSLEKFDIEEVFKIINLEMDELFKIYAEICSQLKELLGSNDMIQLWKNISWSRKKECIGNTRLGVEYLQWAMMLKRCIEDYLKREIFDVDEVNGDWQKVRDVIPSNVTDRFLRGVRNDWFKNKLNDEYEFRLNRKKLFYLANSLTLDYHPRVIIFVEGKTEEVMIPKFFEFYGYNFKDLGFEIVNVEGITKYYSGSIEYKDSDEKIDRVVINNFKNLITFNLSLWQAIPFFIGDNENDIGEKLRDGVIFDTKSLIGEFDKRSYRKVEKEIIDEYGKINEAMIEEWKHIWKYDFELDNFTAFELQIAINDVCHTEYTLDDIQEIYDSCKKGNKKGISSLKHVKRKKVEVNEKAFENLVNYYKETKDPRVSKRPIFGVIEKLLDIHHYNHQPVNTSQAVSNRKQLNSNILIGKDIFIKD